MAKKNQQPESACTNGTCGCCGGQVDARHRRPTDPEWWGDNHWPTPMPHEKQGWFERHLGVPPATLAPAVAPERKGSPAPKEKKVRSTTGLLTIDDFVQEATTLEVLTPEMEAKFDNWFKKLEVGECSPGMARMQCNNLIQGTLRRKSSK